MLPSPEVTRNQLLPQKRVDFSEESKFENTIEVQKIDIAPNPALIQAELRLVVAFTSAREVNNAKWELKYIVDSANARHVISLGTTDGLKYLKGANTFQFQTAGIDISKVPRHMLLNVGMLQASLFENGVTIVDINLIVQVEGSKNKPFTRTIFNPLE